MPNYDRHDVFLPALVAGFLTVSIDFNHLLIPFCAYYLTVPLVCVCFFPPVDRVLSCSNDVWQNFHMFMACEKEPLQIFSFCNSPLEVYTIIEMCSDSIVKDYFTLWDQLILSMISHWQINSQYREVSICNHFNNMMLLNQRLVPKCHISPPLCVLRYHACYWTLPRRFSVNITRIIRLSVCLKARISCLLQSQWPISITIV